MSTLFERLAAKIAYLHARRVYARFLRGLEDVARQQQRVLQRVLPLVAGGEFGRHHALDHARTVDDLKKAVPLTRYEDYRALIDRVADGDSQALFSPGRKAVMFATSSGTTALPKRIPITPEFVRDYRRGWNTFGLKMLSDHPRAVLRAILQSTGRYDAQRTRAGVPQGAITGLLARTQKGIVRRFYVGRPELAYIDDPLARYYTLMRLGLGRDVAFAITANPATLIRLARVVDEHANMLIRDVHDGTLSQQMVSDAGLRGILSAGLRPDRTRAAELDLLRHEHGALRPRDYWRIEFLACWTAGSMGHYLRRLRDWWGPVPVRDIGLLASEGRVSLPLDDNTPIGVLDVGSAIFEFIPADEAGSNNPRTLSPLEIEAGKDYAVVLTNTTGLLRYRLDDVVRVHGRLARAPLVEFLYRAGRVASVAGEKLTENQAVTAVTGACAALGVSEAGFVLAPCWAEPPFYRLSWAGPSTVGLAQAVDRALADNNEEYASRRKSLRLGPVQVRCIPPEAIRAMDRKLLADRQSAAEQYKRPCLFTVPGEDDRILSIDRSARPQPAV